MTSIKQPLYLFSLAAIFLVTLTTTASAGVIQEVEGNDSRSQAKSHGPIGYDADHQTYQGEISTSNDFDSFLIYAPAGTTQVFIDAENLSKEGDGISSGNLYMAIYNDNPDDEMLAGKSFDAGVSGRVGINLSEQGSYYIAAGTGCTLLTPDCWTQPIQYRFTITSSQPLLVKDPGPPTPDKGEPISPPDTEPNNSDNTEDAKAECSAAQAAQIKAQSRYDKAKAAYKKKKTKARAKKAA